jgi:hypothetical protein
VDQKRARGAPAVKLTADELEIIELFRQLSPGGRHRAIGAAEQLRTGKKS